MCWNDGYERKRFEKKLKKQREEYKKQGMTDAQIEEIEKKDWEIYRSDRCYYSHTQPLEFEDDNFDKEDCTPLISRKLSKTFKHKLLKFRRVRLHLVIILSTPLKQEIH